MLYITRDLEGSVGSPASSEEDGNKEMSNSKDFCHVEKTNKEPSSLSLPTVVKMPRSQSGYLSCFLLYWIQKIFALAMFLSLLIWVFVYAGGVGLQDDPQHEFYFHPMAMSFAFIFINGEAITVYRGCRYVAKKKTKTFHGVLQFVAFIFSCLGLKAAWDSHDYAKPPIPNLYSFHSWVGITTFSLFIVQFLGGFFTFALPYASMDLRKKVMPFHRLTGIIIFIMTFVSAMLGYSEKSAWAFKCWTQERRFCSTMFYGHMFALSMVLYVVTVLLVVLQHEWIRKPLPNETHTPISQEADHED